MNFNQPVICNTKKSFNKFLLVSSDALLLHGSLQFFRPENNVVYNMEQSFRICNKFHSLDFFFSHQPTSLIITSSWQKALSIYQQCLCLNANNTNDRLRAILLHRGGSEEEQKVSIKQDELYSKSHALYLPQQYDERNWLLDLSVLSP